MTSFKVLLCIPPDYHYDFPPLGTPALVAFLKHKGICAEQTDLNLKYRKFLLEHVSAPSLSKGEKDQVLDNILKRFFIDKLKSRYYLKSLPGKTNKILPIMPYENYTNSSFYFAETLLSSDYLWQYLQDSSENTFYQFYEKENFLDYLDKKRIDLLGLSIISPSQVVASLTLGLLVKKYLPHIHVSIGGQWPTLYRSVILKKKELFRCFDSVITFEGETPLYKLAMAIKYDKDISSVPNIILKDNKTGLNQSRKEEDLDLLPCPDFDDLPLNEYNGDAHKLTLTYEASRGCYWSKCAYCVDLPLPKPSYRMKSPLLIAKDIKELKKRYSAEFLMLSDPGLSPRHMSEISRQILKRRIEIDWWCMARPDPGFRYQTFKLAARAGLKQINFGFESASDRVCEIIHKGNKKERSLRIIRDCFDAGVKVCLQTMLGLPGETLADGLETIDFLIANKKIISDVCFNPYYLTPSNPIYLDPEKYGIEYKNDSRRPFRFFTPFKNLKGMSQKEEQLLERLYNSLLKKDKGKDRQRETNGASKGRLEFRLNRESLRINYVRDSKSKRFYFVN